MLNIQKQTMVYRAVLIGVYPDHGFHFRGRTSRTLQTYQHTGWQKWTLHKVYPTQSIISQTCTGKVSNYIHYI